MKTIAETDSQFICEIQSPCFQELTSNQVSMIKDTRTQVLFRKGDILTKQGVFASYVLFILKGLVKQYIEDSSNKSYNLRILNQGEFVGLSSVFANNTFQYSAMAITDCQVMLIEKQTIKDIIKVNGNFGLGIISRYSDQNSYLYTVLHDIQFKQMNGRLAGALLYLNNFRNDFPEIFQILSRKDISEFAGISVESTVKILKSLEKDGIIQLNLKDISVLKEDKLKEIYLKG